MITHHHPIIQHFLISELFKKIMYAVIELLQTFRNLKKMILPNSYTFHLSQSFHFRLI